MGKRKAATKAASGDSDGSPKKAKSSDTNDEWQTYDGTLIVYKPRDSPNSTKIAAFDMDSTIITTKSGRTFPTGPKDWKFLYKQVPGNLKQLHDDGFKVVFLTNQLGISKGRMTEGQFREKIGEITDGIQCPVHVQAATTTDKYRKPAIGSWTHLVSKENGGVSVDMAKSFFCGDAAGRPEDKAKKIKKDFSCADRLFALNLGIKFLTPEEQFLKEPPRPFNMPVFNADELCENAKNVDYKKFVGSKQEMIVNVGFPASGKSSFSKKYLVPAGYAHINRDQMGTWQKCVKKAEEALNEGSSVVIDNTNPDIESRSRYTELAKEMEIPMRCFHFETTIEQARHNEVFRQLTTKNHSKIPDMVMNGYRSKFKPPTSAEGFSEIVKIPFSPDFKNKDEEKLYRMYLLEK